MKPTYSEEDRYRIVMNFIGLRGQGCIPIIDFSPLIRYFDDIKPLRPIKKTSHREYEIATRVTYSGQPIDPKVKREACYGRKDAEEYFNWLIYMLTADDKATAEQRKEAVNQLFLFIFVLRDKTPVTLNDFLKARFDWERKVITLKNALKELKSSVEYNDKQNEVAHEDFVNELEKETEKIAKTFERIGDWQQHYQPYLDKLEIEQGTIDNALKGNNSDKKRKH